MLMFRYNTLLSSYLYAILASLVLASSGSAEVVLNDCSANLRLRGHMCPFYIVFIYVGAPALRAVGPLQGSLCSVRVAHPRQGAAFRAPGAGPRHIYNPSQFCGTCATVGTVSQWGTRVLQGLGQVVFERYD